MNIRSLFQKFSQKTYLGIAAVTFGTVGVILLTATHASGNGTLSLTPATGNLSLGATVQVTIYEDSGAVPVNAIEADLSYDQTALQYVSIDTSAGPFNLVGSSSGGNGSVNLGIATTTPVSGRQAVAVVNFKTIDTGPTTITFAATSGMAQASDSTDILGSKSGASFTVTDTTAPTVPSALASATQTATTISLSWTASTDNVGVTNYKVYRNGALVGTTATPAYTDSGLAPSNSYAYTVLATDAAGNASAQSPAKSVSTTADTTAPSVPTNLSMASRTLTSINLSWTGSTDNVGVIGYKIYRNGTQVGTSTATSYSSTGLASGTSYAYTITAYDTAGNTSAASTSSSFSTLADTTAPSVPSGLSSPAQTTSSVTLTWTASTDNVGVANYKIYRNGTQVGTSITSAYTDTGLTAGVTYAYKILATDAAGNASAQSATTNVATLLVPGDANGDGHVNYLDLSIMAAAWQKSTDLRADYNHDGIVNFLDLSLLASNWGK